jgi:c-di-GMP-binding flagellar brake protein YcgR
MTADISSQKQTFFKPVSSDAERQTIINTLAHTGGTMQIKEESAKAGEGQLTSFKALSLAGNSVLAKKTEGPEVPTAQAVTIVFEASKTMFFCSGKVTRSHKGGEYFIEIKKVFELQRRDSFRVTISQKIIKARFLVTMLNGGALAKEFKILDLSAGGVGLLIPEENVALFKPGAILYGIILVGSHDPVDVKAEVKYQRKVTEGKITITHVGCQLIEPTLAVSQRIAFLVNDCHRITFSRIAK